MVRFRNFTVFKEAGSQFPISTIHTCKTQAPAERQPATIVSNVLNRVRMAFPFDTVYQMTDQYSSSFPTKLRKTHERT